MAKVISIGHFVGGSFGCMFNPSTTQLVYAVEGDRDANGFPNFAHTSRKLVEAHAVKVQAERDAAKKLVADIETRNRKAVDDVSTALRRAGITSPLHRLGGKLLGADRLAPASFAAAAELAKKLGDQDWDVMTADGAMYRVRTAHPFDWQSGGVVPLELAAR